MEVKAARLKGSKFEADLHPGASREKNFPQGGSCSWEMTSRKGQGPPQAEPAEIVALSQPN